MTAEMFRSGAADKPLDRAKRWFFGIGAALAMLGFIASANLMMAALAAVYVVAAAMFAGGLLMIVHGFAIRYWSWAILWILCGLLYAGAAIIILYYPIRAANYLALGFAVLFAAVGLMRLMAALAQRHHGWGWLLVSGLFSIAAAFFIGAGWPADSIWVLGVIIAVDLLIEGSMLMLISLTLRRPVLM
ncbi:HdeD family acid-resistance protein [Sphingomonas lycopersici]|uniref:DUF308 domain-containing protein n=1 Tax=Sphingomonas lycopersici TaxID=2951807 RepID=A0AA41ZHW1_9SPHN|nr:DUF308 domain-containing protein [Sphingomonas lycopersici]MCW6535978.1 DUF308 domain-containing protein [Sphingomonas lycopersici]